MRPALVSGPQTGRSHIINISLASFFFSSIGKNSVRNLQYGLKTRLIRGIYLKKLPYVKVRSMFQSWVAFNGGRQGIGGLGLEQSSEAV